MHDALFKAAFSNVEHAAGELRHALRPELAARIDFSTLALEPGNFVDEALKERQSDLLFSVSMGGARVLLYLLFEHQSTVDELMAFRLLRYLIRIWERFLTEHSDAGRLPAVVPIVLHHSKTGWTAPTAFEDLLDLDDDARAAVGDHVPRLRFVLDDISFENDDPLRARAMTAFGRLVLWCLRHARRPRLLLSRLRRLRGLIEEVRRAPDGPEALQLLWYYILATSDREEPEEVLRQLLAAVGEDGKEEIVSAADKLVERGRLEGLNAGRLEGLNAGRLEGLNAGRRRMQRTLLKQLTTRFGALPADAVARVNAADGDQLDRWFDRVLTAATLDDVLRDP